MQIVFNWDFVSYALGVLSGAVIIGIAGSVIAQIEIRNAQKHNKEQ